MGTIKVVNATESTAESGTKSITRGTTPSQVISEINSEDLQQNLNALVGELGGVLNNVEQGQGFKLKQFTVGLEISAKGGVSLIAKLEAGAKAAITLTFEKD